MITVRRVSDLEDIGDTSGDNRLKAAALIMVPAGISLGASYIINKAAYPKEFSLLKWLGIPLAIGLISMAGYFATRIVVGPFEEEYIGEI